jgi:hypothetical protein
MTVSNIYLNFFFFLKNVPGYKDVFIVVRLNVKPGLKRGSWGRNFGLLMGTFWFLKKNFPPNY